MRIRPPYGCLLPLAGFVLLALGIAAAIGSEPEALLRAETGADGGRRPDFSDAPFATQREEMVRWQIAQRGVKDQTVLAALRRVPRHAFVLPVHLGVAYADTPLPIGYGQTISQPYIVGYMTELLELESGDRVLEVGTGSGYQAAILAEIVRETVSIEIIRPLAETAAARLQALGYANITVLHGDGYYGHEARAPYDAIIVTAAATHVPPPLIKQLKPGGRMAIPVGDTAWTQNLLLVEKADDGGITTRNLLAVRFVPLTGEH